MPAELNIPISTLYGFLLALTRITSIFIFIPIPGLRSGPAQVRVVLVLAITLALSGSWPAVPADADAGRLVAWLAWEAMLGLGAGLAVSFVTEALGIAAQLISVQSGYAFASTIDPNTQADSTVLVILSQLLGALLFFTFGLDRQLIAAFAHSLETVPPSMLSIPASVSERIVALGSAMFTTGLRLAMPVIGLLALIDVALALLGRLNAQLQMLSITFPAKMLVAIAMLSGSVLLYGRVFRQDAGRAFEFIGWLLAR